MQTKFTNNLINETSPYLLQHAHNPVQWYPWGEVAFAKARQENKPILLSIGYSACHWCHVMAHESFENEQIAKLMNDNFVNIKVDREERPDLDQIYMNAVQMMTHHGGWPMTVFLNPEGVPFYGGTYFPPEDRYNMPGFPRVLISVAEAYRDRPDDIAQTSSSLLRELRRVSQNSGQSAQLDEKLLDAAYVGMIRSYDSVNGGFGGAPKFPPAMTLEFLLRIYARTGNKDALNIVRHTCEQMANGGIHDQLGGGFHRYSTDSRWLVPHFEKMLYDNALLSRLYLHLFQVTNEDQSRIVAQDILDYVRSEMTDASGAFYSTQDADSEGHEGKFFIWGDDEIDSILGVEDAKVFKALFNVTPGGNFEGRNILNITRTIDEVAAKQQMPLTEVTKIVERCRHKLFDIRESRVKPDRDEKVLTSWNALMLASFSEAGAILNRLDYTDVAKRNADFLLSNLIQKGLLLRTYKNGIAKLNAYLEDYAFLVEALITLHETTGESRWLKESIALTDKMIEEFWDSNDGGFFFTGKSHENLIVRSKDYFDNATPSGNSVAANVLLRLALITGKERYRTLAVTVLRDSSESMRHHPSAFGYALSAVDFLLSRPKEVAIVTTDDGDARAFVHEVWRLYLPNKVVAVGSQSSEASFPILANRHAMSGLTTAYVCENYTCQRPVTSTADLANQLISLNSAIGT